jgi:hypothetical protein
MPPSRTATGVGDRGDQPVGQEDGKGRQMALGGPGSDEATISRVYRDHYQPGLRHPVDAPVVAVAIVPGAELSGPPP